MIYAILYVICVLAANYTATWFLPLPEFGFISVGTIIFGATFTLRDYVHRLGKLWVYSMIFIAVALSTLMSIWFSVEWRVVLASAIAILLSETVDTEIFHALKKRSWITKVWVSNAFSVPVDTLLFNSIAFFGVFAGEFLLAVVIGEIVVKYIVAALVGIGRLKFWNYQSV